MSNILVVDDSPLVRAAFQLWLESAGHTVELAANTQEALDKFQPGLYSLAITDLERPGEDGLELIKKLRTLEPGLKIILCSAKMPKEHGADAFVNKDDGPHALLAAVNQLLDQ